MPTPGEILKAERERKGLSIKDVEQSTSIRALYLSAIEEGKYSVVPGEVYLKGFIRNYAAFLGLNSQELVELYRQMQTPSAIPPTSQDTVEKPAAKTAVKQPTASEKVKEDRASSSPAKWAVILLVPMIASAGFWWYSQKSPEPSNQINNVKPLPAAPSQPTPVPPPAVPSVPAQSKPVVVIAKFTDECWAQVIVDGKEVYEGIPKVGESFTWEAQQTITLKLGNASGVDITYNGIPQGKLGAKGDVLAKTFTPKQ